MSRGGKRPGAGRPKGAVTRIKHDSLSAGEKRIGDRLPTLLDNLFALADGVKEERELPSGKTIVYTTPPDLRANIYLVDRVLGKPTNRHEHDLSHLSDEELIARATELFADFRPDGADSSDGTPCQASRPVPPHEPS